MGMGQRACGISIQEVCKPAYDTTDGLGQEWDTGRMYWVDLIGDGWVGGRGTIIEWHTPGVSHFILPSKLYGVGILISFYGSGV